MERTRRPGSLLDVGTGIGQFLFHARSSYSNVTGTEVSDSAIQIASEKYHLAITKGDVEKLELGEAVFDNVTIFHVLEHVPSPKALIERCRALLVPGGILVIAVPNDVLGIRYRAKFLMKKLGVHKFASVGKLGLRRITLDGTMDEIHVSHFAPGVLERTLEKSGFSVLENSLDPYFAATGLRRLFENTHYALCLVLRSLFRVNVYDTIWIVGRKNAA